MLTDSRIMTVETEKLFWFPIFHMRQFFLLEDLHHVQFSFDSRARYIIYGAILMGIGISLHSVDYRFIYAFESAAFIFWLRFAYALFTKETLALHFYKKEAVYSWLTFLRNYFIPPKEGATRTISLCLTSKQSRALMTLLYEHDLCPLLKKWPNLYPKSKFQPRTLWNWLYPFTALLSMIVLRRVLTLVKASLKPQVVRTVDLRNNARTIFWLNRFTKIKLQKYILC